MVWNYQYWYIVFKWSILQFLQICEACNFLLQLSSFKEYLCHFSSFSIKMSAKIFCIYSYLQQWNFFYSLINEKLPQTNIAFSGSTITLWCNLPPDWKSRVVRNWLNLGITKISCTMWSILMISHHTIISCYVRSPAIKRLAHKSGTYLQIDQLLLLIKRLLIN